MRILILEPEDYSPTALQIYRSMGQVFLWPELSWRRRIEAKRKADVLVVRLGFMIDKCWFQDMPALKIIATPTTGLNHIDMEASLSRKIKVVSLRGQSGFLKNITSTAELALGLMIALVRNLPSAFDSVREGDWNRMSFRGYQLSGKVLGIIGYGRLGKLMARYTNILGMKVVAHDPFAKPAKNIDFVSLEMLFKISDVVSLHALLTEKNHGFIKLKHFGLMKPTAYFVNTARAELIERNALCQALSRKMMAGAAIDVMDDEDSKGEHLKKDSLWKYARTHNNLIITPHIGGASFEAMHITEEFIANEVKKYLFSKKPN